MGVLENKAGIGISIQCVTRSDRQLLNRPNGNTQPFGV